MGNVDLINKVILGDCLEVMPQIEDRSVDLILTDLPYGQSGLTGKWDKVIPVNLLWEQYKRIIKVEGAIVLFSAQPFTSLLISSNLEMFKYEWIWKKSKSTGYFDVQYRPMRKHENIVVFGFGGVSNCSNPRMKYSPQNLIKLEKAKIRKGKSPDATCRTAVVGKGEQKYTNFPNTLLEFGSESKTVHPTQKPLLLCEYLVKTYTNKNDLVLDNTCGSGTTLVAARNLNRNFIGIEKEKKYYDVCLERLNNQHFIAVEAADEYPPGQESQELPYKAK